MIYFRKTIEISITISSNLHELQNLFVESCQKFHQTRYQSVLVSAVPD